MPRAATAAERPSSARRPGSCVIEWPTWSSVAAVRTTTDASLSLLIVLLLDVGSAFAGPPQEG